MLSLIVLTVIFTSVILLTSQVFKVLGKKILLPLISLLISLVLIIISFIVGGWDGIGIGATSLSLLFASIITYIAIVLIYQTKDENHHPY